MAEDLEILPEKDNPSLDLMTQRKVYNSFINKYEKNLSVVTKNYSKVLDYKSIDCGDHRKLAITVAVWKIYVYGQI